MGFFPLDPSQLISCNLLMSESFTITDAMRTAAKSVAMTHEHYLQHCHTMHTLKGKPEAMAVVLKQRKDAHVAYHVALEFLKEATLQANPQLDLGRDKTIHWRDRPQKQALLDQNVDAVLNKLITESLEAENNPPPVDHSVIRAAQQPVWG